MFISKLDRQIGPPSDLTRTVPLRAAFALMAVCLLTQPVYSQTRSDTPPPILKGGIVHQLRSLSEDALSALMPDELDSVPTPAAHRRPQPAMTSPPQPTGRATLRRTHASPWVERFQGEAAARHGVDPTSLASSDPSEVNIPRTRPANGIRSGDTVRPLNFESKPAGTARSSEPVHPTITVERRQPSGRPDAPPAYDWNAEVHVAESLPQVVRQSIRAKESAASSPSSDASGFQDDRQESTDEAMQVFPPYSDSAQSDLPPPGAMATANSIPQVARIPLPGGQPREPATPRDAARAEAGSARTADPSPTELRPHELRPHELRPHELPSPEFAGPELRRTELTGHPPEFEAGNDPAQLSLPDLGVSDIATVELPQLPAVAEQSSQTPPSLPALPSLDGQPESTGVRVPTAMVSAPKAGQKRVQQPASPERLRMQTPRIEVLLIGPGDLPVGAPARYEIVVQNNDTIDLSGLLLRLDIPAGVEAQASEPSLGEMEVEQAGNGATLFTWSFTDLRAGGSATAPIDILAKSARNFGVALEWTVMPIAGSAKVDVLAPQLELVLEGPAEVSYGEANTYRLHVRNPGTADAEAVAVKLSAEPYGASSTEIGTIKAGAEETIDVELTFNETGTINIAAQASAANDLASSTKINVIVRRPNLTATIKAPEMIYHGAVVDYSVLIGNTGDAEAKDVTATLTLPQGAKLIHLPNMATLRDRKLVWSIARLKPGETFELPLQLNLNEAGENKLSIACTTPVGLTSDFTASTTVQAFADLKLLMEDPVAPAAVGTEVVYGLNLTNRGSKVANNVRVIAQFSEGIEPIRGEGSQARIAPGQLFFEPIKRIEPGQTITLKVIAVAEKDGMHRFRAEVKSDDTEQKLVQEEATQYLNKSQGRIASPPSQNVIR